MARGYEGAFGRKWNSPWLLVPLGLLFLLPFVDFRRPLRLLHLDLLVLLGFGVSHVFFNRGDIGVSVPLAYPVLLYVMGRMLWEGWRRRERIGRARAARTRQLPAAGARLPRRIPNRPERDRLERHRRRLLGRDRRGPDRRRRLALRRRVRARQRERERLRAGRLPGVRAVGAAPALGRDVGRPARGPCRGDHVRPADHARAVRAGHAPAREGARDRARVRVGRVPVQPVRARRRTRTTRSSQRCSSGRSSPRRCRPREARWSASRPPRSSLRSRVAPLFATLGRPLRYRGRVRARRRGCRRARSCRTAACATSTTRRSASTPGASRRSASGDRSRGSTGSTPS